MKKTTSQFSAILAAFLFSTACGVDTTEPLPFEPREGHNDVTDDIEDVIEDVDTTPEVTETPVFVIEGRPKKEVVDDAILGELGFRAQNAEEAVAPSGAVSASFTAPVVSLLTNDEFIDVEPGVGSLDVNGVVSASYAIAIADGVVDDDLFYIALVPEEGYGDVLVIATRQPLIVDGELVLDGENAAALTYNELTGEGSLAASGTLQLSNVDLDVGTLSGVLASPLYPVTLESWPEDLFLCPVDDEEYEEYEEWETDPEACTELPGLAETFTPTGGALFSGFTTDELPPGYNRVLVFFSDNDEMGLQILLPEDAALDVGVDLAPVESEYGLMPKALIFNNCERPLFVDAGTLTGTLEDGTFDGTVTFTSESLTRTITLNVPVEDMSMYEN